MRAIADILKTLRRRTRRPDFATLAMSHEDALRVAKAKSPWMAQICARAARVTTCSPSSGASTCRRHAAHAMRADETTGKERPQGV